MRKKGYVDEQGNVVDPTFESKKTILNILFTINVIVPLIIIGMLIYKVVVNYNCNKLYTTVKDSVNSYLKDTQKLPDVGGETTVVKLDKLYEQNYISLLKTNNQKITGKVKVTKYKTDKIDKYIYTLDLHNCKSCSTSKFNHWTNELNTYPNKTVVDVIPYYNYYEREINTTKWSKYYDPDEISREESAKYGVKMPKELDDMPEVPADETDRVNVTDVVTESKDVYSYRDKKWKWYNIQGDYSEYSSTQPPGYSNRDDASMIQTEWSDYSQNYPTEESYRDIKSATGYKFYYINDDGQKVYANNGEYTARDDVDEKKYDKKESSYVTLYKYSDKMWRWYNGTKRSYTNYYSTAPNGYNFKEEKTVSVSSYSSWSEKSSITAENQSYREEKKKTQTRYAYQYEYLSNLVLDEYQTKDEFINTIGMTVPEFDSLEEYKVDIKYKFKYKK